MNFVSVQHTEFSHSYWQIPVRMLSQPEHNAMARAVHRLESMFFLIVVDPIYVFLVLEVVTTDLPQLPMIHVGTNNLRIAPNPVLGSHEFHQTVVDDSSMGIEQSRTWGEMSEMKEILL